MLKSVSARFYRIGQEVMNKSRARQLRHISSERLAYSDFGDPLTVLRKETGEVNEKGKVSKYKHYTICKHFLKLNCQLTNNYPFKQCRFYGSDSGQC